MLVVGHSPPYVAVGMETIPSLWSMHLYDHDLSDWTVAPVFLRQIGSSILGREQQRA